MTENTNRVSMDIQEVSNGVTQWENASTALQSAWETKIAKIKSYHNATTFGGDDAGQTFQTQYLTTDQASTFLDADGQKAIKEVTGLGAKARTAAGYSVAANREQGIEMAQEVPNISLPGGTA